MSTLDLDILYQEELYNNYLQEISGKKFTLREIDIIACILHNRGEKKVASLLGISYRTVGVHVRNIYSKLGQNSKDYIIDLVEKSGKLGYIHQYYFNILIQSSFKSYLQKIGSINHSNIICSTNFSKAPKEENLLLTQIETTLKLANISLIDQSEENDKIQCKFKLYVVDKKLINNTNSILDCVKSLKTASLSRLLLILINGTPVPDEIGNLESINFKLEENYYFSLCKLLDKIIDDPRVTRATKEFIDECNSLKDLVTVKTQDNKILTIKSTSSSRIKSILLIIANIAVVISLVIAWRVTSKEKVSEPFANEQNATAKLDIDLVIQDNINKILPRVYEGLSVRNITRKESEHNYSIIKLFDQVVEQIELEKIQNYFIEDNLKSNELINCIYNLNAVASYYFFKEHNTTKVEKILRYAKTLSENLISNRSKLKINFDKLTPAELYTELAIIQDLPEIYTVTVYFLGRSFLFQGNTELAEKNFELSKYLGDKLGLLEGLLSVNNGFTLIKEIKANIKIKHADIANARTDLIECIEVYKKTRKDNNIYIKNFVPNTLTQTILIPKGDIYNFADCSKRISRLYTKLAEITDNRVELNSYLEKVSNEFIGKDTLFGLLEILKRHNKELSQIVADSYNILGYFLLNLYDKNIDFTKFKNSLVIKLNLTNGDDLKVIYQIFDLAKLLSRSTEFAKADAYDGLIEVLIRLTNRPNVSEEEKKRLLFNIQELEESRDLINIG